VTTVQVSETSARPPPPVLADEVRRRIAGRLARVLNSNRVARLGIVRRCRPPPRRLQRHGPPLCEQSAMPVPNLTRQQRLEPVRGSRAASTIRAESTQVQPRVEPRSDVGCTARSEAVRGERRQAGSSSMPDGSRSRTPFTVCRKSLDRGYATRRERMSEPRGRWASSACHGLNDRTSSA